jgi:hypothetical protein
MARAGYDPGALLRYLDRIQPRPDERVTELEHAIEALSPAT